MTARTATRDIRMIKYGGQPGVGAMAVLTGLATEDVICGLTFLNRIVVATGTGAKNLQMVHTQQRLPANALMTVFTHICRVYMGRCFIV